MLDQSPHGVGSIINKINNEYQQKYNQYFIDPGTGNVETTYINVETSKAQWGYFHFPNHTHVESVNDPNSGTSTGIQFNKNGTRMWVTSHDNQVYQYDLSAPYALSTASQSHTDFFGTYSSTHEDVYVSPDEKHIFALTSSNDVIYHKTMNTAGTLNDGTTVVDSGGTASNYPMSIWFKPDGTKMYVANGSTENSVYEFTLDSPWDHTNKTQVNTVTLQSIGGQYVRGLALKPDGRKMYVARSDNNLIAEWVLDTPWDTTTASHNQDMDVSANLGRPSGIDFKETGDHMAITGWGDGNWHKYELR